MEPKLFKLTNLDSNGWVSVEAGIKVSPCDNLSRDIGEGKGPLKYTDQQQLGGT